MKFIFALLKWSTFIDAFFFKVIFENLLRMKFTGFSNILTYP